MKSLIRRSKGKRRAQLIHAKRRFEGRFDKRLNSNQYQQLINMIKKGSGEFIRKQSNRVTIWELQLDGKPIRVVYDKRTKAIVTALYEDLDELKHGKGNIDDYSNHPKELV